ncbi:MAG: hypothetical protein R3E39_11095 [Anaerolineae bacterium]
MDGISARDGEEALIADGQAMVDAIVGVVRDDGLRARLGEQGRSLIEAADAVAEGYIRLYETLAN